MSCFNLSTSLAFCVFFASERAVYFHFLFLFFIFGFSALPKASTVISCSERLSLPLSVSVTQSQGGLAELRGESLKCRRHTRVHSTRRGQVELRLGLCHQTELTHF